MKSIYAVLLLFLLLITCTSQTENSKSTTNPQISINEFPDILHYQVDPRKGKLHFFSQDEAGNYFKNHKGLKEYLTVQNKNLVFAMNGGMYLKDLSAQGLYIENGKKKKEVDRKKEGYGNFYLKPNGIFVIKKDNTAEVMVTEKYAAHPDIQYATQSGPMLLTDGKIHHKFNQDSKNLHIRNGVGILPNGDILFAMSKKKVNFYRMAEFFQKNKCHNALYLDGFVSRTYLPSKNWEQEEGKFGIIIAEIE